MLLVYPAMMSLDLRRRRSGRSDLFCCCTPAGQTTPNRVNNNNNRPMPSSHNHRHKSHKTHHQSVSKRYNEDSRVTTALVEGQTGVRRVSNMTGNNNSNYQDPENMSLMGCAEPDCWSFSLTRLASRHYAPFLMKPSVKVILILLFIIDHSFILTQNRFYLSHMSMIIYKYLYIIDLL